MRRLNPYFTPFPYTDAGIFVPELLELSRSPKENEALPKKASKVATTIYSLSEVILYLNSTVQGS